MRRKFFKKIIQIICVLSLLIPISLEVLAAITSTQEGTEQVFGITHLHTSKYLNGTGEKEFGYRISDRNTYRIYAGSNNESGFENTIVCLDKLGKFPAEDSATDKYKSLGEATSEVLQTIKTTQNGTKTNLTAEDSQKIIWLMNNAVLPEDSAELRDVKLAKIFSDTIESTTTTQNPLTIEYIKSILTEDDLVFALQATIWSITNPMANPVYKGTTNGITYNTLSGNDTITSQGKQGEFINIIINYYKDNYAGSSNIVASTDDNLVVPKITTPSNKLIFTNDDELQPSTGEELGTIDNGYIFVGPFKIETSEEGKNTVDYSIDISFEDENGNKITGTDLTYFLKEGKTKDSTTLAQTKNGLEGKEFYVALKKGVLVRKLNINLNSASITSDTKITAWSVEGNENMQPLVSIERTQGATNPVTASYEFTATYVREYDVSLRKFIKSVYRCEDAGVRVLAQNRAPTVTESVSKEFNQYEYTHQKTPVEVEVGDIVRYTIRVYNEGKYNVEIRRVVDYLPPSGLQFLEQGDVVLKGGVVKKASEATEIDKDEGHEVKYQNQATLMLADNKITITPETNQTSIGKSQLIGMQNVGNEKATYLDIELEFLVTEEAKGKIVTNIAEVAEFAGENDVDGDGNGDGEFVIQTDCDSEPYNISENLPQTEEEWEEYKGNTQNQDELTDDVYYYKGHEDDDDFEKIIIPGPEGEYNIELLKVDSNNNAIRLQDAEFKITLPDGSTQINKTDATGIIKIENIEITQTGTDIITIEETNPPKGYNKLTDTLTLTVNKIETTENNTSVYKANNVTIADSSGINRATASISGNTISATVPNEKITENYNISLIKVDDNDNTLKLPGAEFKITLPSGEIQTKTTDGNGTLQLDPIEITQTGTDTITIEETKAPVGYNKLTGTLTLTITKESTIENNKTVYKPSNISIADSNNSNKATANLTESTILVTVPNEKNTGNYNISLAKVDNNNNATKLSGAEFKITLPNGEIQTKTTDGNGTLQLDPIEVTQIGTDTIKIEETKAPEGYEKLNKTLTVTVTKEETIENNKTVYKASQVEITENDTKNKATANLTQSTVSLVVPNSKNPVADLALRKYIVKVGQTDISDRQPSINYDKVNDKINYNHKKEPVILKAGDNVIYNITIYNEGNKEGTATKVKDYLPEGLEFVEDSEINAEYGWIKSNEGYIITEYTKAYKLAAFDKENETISKVTLQVECKVKENVKSGVLTNLAEIAEDDIDDIDSTPNSEAPIQEELPGYKGNEENKDELNDSNYFYKGQEDDDDFEKVVIEPPLPYDLALKKYVSSVSDAT
ncbi:MAG: collagen binding domain-containing protein, partial [Clostridia bacterium]